MSKLWNMRMKDVSFINGTQETILKSQRKRLEELEIKGSDRTEYMLTLVKTRRGRRVLEYRRDLLPLDLRYKSPVTALWNM